MTEPGVILGTAAYMSPEQAMGKAVDKRADIWSFGCLLFECLTGKRPFQGKSFSETLASILKDEPDWNKLNVDTPLSVHRLVFTAIVAALLTAVLFLFFGQMKTRPPIIDVHQHANAMRFLPDGSPPPILCPNDKVPCANPPSR